MLALVASAVVASPTARADDGPSPAQKQAIYAKASVVRVVGYWEVTFSLAGREAKEFVGGMGSGFFISADGFIATNAHVVEDIKNGEQRAKQAAFSQLMGKLRRQFGADLDAAIVEELRRSARVVENNDVVLPDGTKLKYEVKAYGAPVGEGKDVAIIKVDLKDAPNLTIGDSEKVQIQDKVLAIGYPGAADMNGLLDSKSQLEASITDGAVSALKRTADGEPVLQVSVPITHGNSGGPAINDHGEVIGLTTFGSRNEVQGFNFLVASSTVQKFVREAKADNTPSKTMVAWKKALDELWAGDLDAAITDFEEVLTLFPTHSEAPRMLKQARQLKKEGKGKPKQAAVDAPGGSNNGVAVAIVIVLVFVVIGVIVMVKRKKPAAAPLHAGHAPPGLHPGQHPMQMPPQHPAHATGPMAHQSQPMNPMMAGHSGPAPVAKTVAIGASASQPIAKTAFASFTMGSLTCTRGLLHGQRFSLSQQGLLIGRQPGVAQIVVNDSRASGKHVWIGFENGQLVAVDQGTTNGTFVNDVHHGRISKVPLKDGDTVIVAEPDCLSLTLKLS